MFFVCPDGRGMYPPFSLRPFNPFPIRLGHLLKHKSYIFFVPYKSESGYLSRERHDGRGMVTKKRISFSQSPFASLSKRSQRTIWQMRKLNLSKRLENGEWQKEQSSLLRWSNWQTKKENMKSIFNMRTLFQPGCFEKRLKFQRQILKSVTRLLNGFCLEKSNPMISPFFCRRPSSFSLSRSMSRREQKMSAGKKKKKKKKILTKRARCNQTKG